jgi:hypothetical protein
MISISKHRLASLASASALIVTVAVASVPAAAMAGPAAKATGDVYADRSAEGLGTAHMVFVAQATSPAKGTFTYSDQTGGSYTINVQNVQVDSTTVVHFAGPVVTSTYPGVGVGSFVGIAVKDGGEPGIGVDKVNGQVYGSLADAVRGYVSLQPTFLTASAGNVQVIS